MSDATVSDTQRTNVSLFGRLIRLVWRTLLFLCSVVILVAVLGAAMLRSDTLRPHAIRGGEQAVRVWNDTAQQVGADQLTVSPELLTATQQDAKGAEQEGATTSSAEQPGEPANEVAHVTTVKTVTVGEGGQTTISRTYTGAVTPGQTSELGFKHTGRIEEVLVDQGQTVEKGTPLARLDTRSLQADRAVLNAELNAAQARLDELRAGPRKQTIAAARARMEEFRAMQELWRVTANRRVRLVAQDAASSQDLDDARLQLRASQNRYEAQIQVVKELEAGTRKEQVAAQEAVVEKLKASLKSVDIKLDESELKAPFAAMVSKRMADEGIIVAPGTVVMRLVQQDKPEAWIGLPVHVASELDTGSLHDIRIGEQSVSAQLVSILPELDSVTRTQTAIFVLDQIDFRIRFGQIARLDWDQHKDTVGYWLPTGALTHGVRGLWAVFAVVPDTKDESRMLLERRDVEVLQIESDRVMVRGMIKTDDQVVAAGVQKLVPGQAVAIGD